MIKGLFFGLLSLLICTRLFGQTQLDSSSFSSVEEFHFYQNYQPERAFDLFFLIDLPQGKLSSMESARTQFHQFLAELKADIIGKREKKQAGILYKEIHNRYFAKYAENPNFHDIFFSQNYNCATASALYALACEYLAIPYQIKETPTHVYLLLFPFSEKIVFETTTPENGFQKIDRKQLEQYKEALIANKIVTQEEANQQDFFQSYILIDENVSLRELGGILYYNNACKYGEMEKDLQALNQLEKAYHFYNTEYNRTWLNFYLIRLLQNNFIDQSGLIQCQTFAKLVNYNLDSAYDVSELPNLFGSLLKEVIKKEEGDSSVLFLKKCLSEHIEQGTLSTAFMDVANLILAEYYYKALNPDKALYYIGESYKKGNQGLNLFIRDCLAEKFRGVYDSAAGLDSIDKYENIYPFIKDEVTIQSAKVWFHMKLVYGQFELNEKEEGLKYLEDFRAAFPVDQDLSHSEDMIGVGFGAASAYEVRQGNYDAATRILEEGLKYAPSSVELKRKLKYLDDL